MMNELEINNTLTKLKSTSNSVVYDSLLVIRKNILQSQHGVKLIREKHALKDLVNFLHKPNEKILDVTMSILGNCCLEHESRIEVANYGIIGPLIAVLHNINRDSIQGRACRLVGNLAQTYSIALELHKKGVIGGLVVAVDMGGNSIATRQMAVRALRLLWNVQSQRANMLELNAVHKVATLLATSYETKEEEELLNAVIKALVVFSYQCSEQCARQICVGGSDLHSLLSLLDKINLKDSIIICVSNLCHNANARLILGIANAVEVIVKELSDEEYYTRASTEVYTALVSTLCLFSRESVNRSKIRRAGGLPIILAILRDSPVPMHKSRALHALAHFIYDELSLLELLKEGMVTVLIAELGEFVKDNGRIHRAVKIKPKPNSKRPPSSKIQHSSTVCNTKTEDITGGKCFDECNPNMNEESGGVSDPRSAANGSDTSGSWKALKRFRVSSPSYLAVLQEQWHKEKSSDPSPASPSHSYEYKYNGGSLEPCIPLSPAKSWTLESVFTAEWSPNSSSSQFSPDPPTPYRMWPTASTSPTHDLLSGASSPVSYSSTDCDWPEMYSPVCHDVQSDEEEVKECSFEEEKSDEPISIDKCDSCSNSPELKSISSLSENLNAGTDQGLALNLLSRVSHMETPVEDLAVYSTLITLLDYIILLQNPLPRAARVLRRIVRNHHYFLKIISHQFVLSVYTRLCQPLHHDCLQCNKLVDLGRSLLAQISMVTATGYGEGELSHHMLRPDVSVRRMLAITIPYIVNTPRLLKRLLIDCKGLDILQDILERRRAEEEVFVEHIPTGLTLLAATLNISCPENDTPHEDRACLMQHTLQNIAKNIAQKSDDTIILRLDDGCTIPTSKDFLCKHSPVFEAMLQGSFKESTQQSVRLQDICAISMAHLLYIMKLERVPHCLPDLSFPVAMELLAALDKFLLPGSDQLTELIIRQFLSPRTVVNMYQHMYNKGTLSHCDYIRAKTIKFILAAKMTSEERMNIFNKLLETSYSQQVLKDIFDLLRERLSGQNMLSM